MTDLSTLVRRWNAGDQDAAREMFDLYVDKLVAITDRRIAERLKGRFDPEDVVISAFRSFFGRVREKPTKRSDELWRFLAAITRNKLLRKIEHHSQKKRDYKVDEAGDFRFVEMCFGAEPTEQDYLELQDELAHLLSQESEEHREIIVARLKDVRVREMGEVFDKSEALVRDILKRFRRKLEQRLSALRE